MPSCCLPSGSPAFAEGHSPLGDSCSEAAASAPGAVGWSRESMLAEAPVTAVSVSVSKADRLTPFLFLAVPLSGAPHGIPVGGRFRQKLEDSGGAQSLSLRSFPFGCEADMAPGQCERSLLRARHRTSVLITSH